MHAHFDDERVEALGLPFEVIHAGTDAALFAELARRGYSQADLEKISSRNMMRVMREAGDIEKIVPSMKVSATRASTPARSTSGV